MTLADLESDPASLDVSYRDLDGTLRPATPAAPGLTENLSTSPAGVTRLYVWDSSADLPGVSTPAAQLVFRARDSEPGPEAAIEFPLDDESFTAAFGRERVSQGCFEEVR